MKIMGMDPCIEIMYKRDDAPCEDQEECSAWIRWDGEITKEVYEHLAAFIRMNCTSHPMTDFSSARPSKNISAIRSSVHP